MNAQEAFLVAAFLCGLTSFGIAILWQLTGTNQGDHVKHQSIGASACAFYLALFCLFLSYIVK